MIDFRKRGVIVPTGERRTSRRPRRNADGNPVWAASDPTKLAAEIIEREQQLNTVVATESSDDAPPDYSI